MRATILLLAIGCATGASTKQTVTLRSSINVAAPPVRISVGKGHVSGGALNAWLDDGCVHGNYGNTPVSFCRDDNGTGPVQHWSGPSGEFTVAPSEDGGRIEVDGYWMLDTRRQASMVNSLELGTGPEWDELRRNPALLAVAATAADLQAGGITRR